MKYIIAGLIFLTLITLTVARNFVLVETYLLPPTLPRGWVHIEYDNPDCPPLNQGLFGITYAIPENGYLCTSSPSEKGLVYNKFYLINSYGENFRLAIGKDIRQLRSFNINRNNCRISGHEFFYGSEDEIRNIPQNLLAKPEMQKIHPECRSS